MISIDLKILANKLEQEADSILAKAEKNPEQFQKVAEAVALASCILERTAKEFEGYQDGITEEKIDEIAALATSFDESGDEFLMKQASVLDELLMTIAAPKNVVAQANKVTEDEIARLSEKYRSQKRDEYYEQPKESIDKFNQAKETTEAVDKVKRFEPLEAPLQTRYSPDYPGQSMIRISDSIYQDPITGKIYDFKTGYTTNKGNKVPGGSVENQGPDLGTSQMTSGTMFSTRENIMSRFTSDNSDKNIKTG